MLYRVKRILARVRETQGRCFTLQAGPGFACKFQLHDITKDRCWSVGLSPCGQASRAYQRYLAMIHLRKKVLSWSPATLSSPRPSSRTQLPEQMNCNVPLQQQRENLVCYRELQQEMVLASQSPALPNSRKRGSVMLGDMKGGGGGFVQDLLRNKKTARHLPGTCNSKRINPGKKHSRTAQWSLR